MYTQCKSAAAGIEFCPAALFSCWMTHTCEILIRASRLSRGCKCQQTSPFATVFSKNSNFRVQVSFDVSHCSFADANSSPVFLYPRKNEPREQEIHFPVGIWARLPDYESVAAFVMLNAAQQFLTLLPILFISPRMHVQFGPGRIQITAGTHQLCLLSRLGNVHRWHTCS